MYKLLLLSLITFSPVSAMLTPLKIKTPVTRFLIQHRDSFTEVRRENVDPILLRLNQKQLARFSEVGYLKVSQLSDGEFKLRAFAKGKGGGPWAAGGAVLASAPVSIALTIYRHYLDSK